MKQKTILRLVLLIVVMLGLAAIAKFTPLGEYMEFQYLIDTLQEAGLLGGLIFLIVFIGGTITALPGMLFMALAILVYGFKWGILLAYFGTVLSALVHFVIIRFIGGKAFEEIQKPFFKKMMSRLDSQPVKTVIILRTVFFAAPPLNYALALSTVRTSTLR